MVVCQQEIILRDKDNRRIFEKFFECWQKTWWKQGKIVNPNKLDTFQTEYWDEIKWRQYSEIELEINFQQKSSKKIGPVPVYRLDLTVWYLPTYRIKSGMTTCPFVAEISDEKNRIIHSRDLPEL
jgi:hypothetical protein